MTPKIQWDVNMEQIHILAVQKGWLAVDKPSGLSVHNDPGGDLISVLFDWIKADPLLARDLGAGPAVEIHPVHRLDKETSGAILLAADNKTLPELSELFMQHQVKKTYIALVHGVFDEDIKGFQYWDNPLTKTAGGRHNPSGRGKRVDCKTRYKILQQSRRYALLEIDLLTGRKHQIRRHAKLAGHPVTGDARYGSKRSVKYLRDVLEYHRMGLHCKSLEFVTPGSKDQFIVESINPLSEMMRLLSQDR